MKFYNLPVIVIFLVFIIVIPFFAVLGLIILKSFKLKIIKCGEGGAHNAVVSIFVAVIAGFLGVLISFLIVTVWNIAKQANLNSQQEAQAIFVLYQNMYALPNTEEIQAQIIEYLEYIINVEYPQLKNGEIPVFSSEILGNLQKSIYDYKDTGANTFLYSNSIQKLNDIVSLRVSRIHDATIGLKPALWLVCLMDATIIILMTYFLNCDGKFAHYFYVYVISTFIASLLFLIYILNLPFRGSSGLSPHPFEEALVATQKYKK